jgi:hypothetical protein
MFFSSSTIYYLFCSDANFGFYRDPTGEGADTPLIGCFVKETLGSLELEHAVQFSFSRVPGFLQIGP